MLAWCAMHLPPHEFQEKSKHHMAQARRSLIEKLKTPALIDFPDVFAACILTEIAWNNNSPVHESIHITGCLSMLKHLSDSIVGKPISGMLAVFGPYVLNRLNLFSAAHYDCTSVVPSADFPQRRTTFRQRVQYRNELRRVSRQSIPGYQIDLIEGVHDTLGDLVWILTYCWTGCLDREIADELRPYRIVDDILQYVGSELNDPEFRQAAVTIQQLSHARRMKGENPEVQLAVYQLLQLDFINLVQKILATPSMLQARQDPELTSMARELILFFRQEFPKEGAIRYYYCHAYTQILLLAAWLLPLNGLSERNFRLQVIY